jgi:hypothetical protein
MGPERRDLRAKVRYGGNAPPPAYTMSLYYINHHELHRPFQAQPRTRDPDNEARVTFGGYGNLNGLY